MGLRSSSGPVHLNALKVVVKILGISDHGTFSRGYSHDKSHFFLWLGRRDDSDERAVRQHAALLMLIPLQATIIHNCPVGGGVLQH